MGGGSCIKMCIHGDYIIVNAGIFAKGTLEFRDHLIYGYGDYIAGDVGNQTCISVTYRKGGCFLWVHFRSNTRAMEAESSIFLESSNRWVSIHRFRLEVLC